MPALNFLPLPRVSHPKPPAQTDGLPTLPGPCQRIAPTPIEGGVHLVYPCPPDWSDIPDSARGIHTYLGSSYAFPELPGGVVPPHPLVAW